MTSRDRWERPATVRTASRMLLALAKLPREHRLDAVAIVVQVVVERPDVVDMLRLQRDAMRPQEM